MKGTCDSCKKWMSAACDFYQMDGRHTGPDDWCLAYRAKARTYGDFVFQTAVDITRQYAKGLGVKG